MDQIIIQAKKLNIWSTLDIEFALMLTKYSSSHQKKTLIFASACLSAYLRVGHTCLPLSCLTLNNIFNGNHLSLAQQIWHLLDYPSLEDWRKLLLSSNAVSDGSCITPLVLDNNKLYLRRIWQHECIVANFFNNLYYTIDINKTYIINILNKLFINKNQATDLDWQKVAVAIAITHPIVLIYGGPGTGKSYTVAKILAVLLLINNDAELNIILAAPTGKAAIRLYESINLTIQCCNLNDKQKRCLPKKAITIHQMLGAASNSNKMHFNDLNPIKADILIIDEASMIDLTMMANIIVALPKNIRIIFLSDPCQISSIEAGSVMKELHYFSKIGYSISRGQELCYLTGYKIPYSSNNNSNISDSTCILRKNYRFSNNSGIHLLANAINSGDVNQALIILNKNKYSDLCYLSLRTNENYQKMMLTCINEYIYYLRSVNNNKSLIDIMHIFNQFRLICALREGAFGITGLNTCIEQSLSRINLINYTLKSNFYLGKPIMILRNVLSLGLSNGDVGIILADQDDLLYVNFLLSNGSIRKISLNNLPKYETAFAMTIHKSQGSEFNKIILILPNQYLPILTRELLYTAVTRARQHLLIYATDQIISYAILNKTNRYSGLLDRLKK